MGSMLKINSNMTVVRSVVPRALRAHPVVTLLVVGVLFGGGLRFVPASTAAVPGSSAVGASTACAAK
jgi:hypothetical protein